MYWSINVEASTFLKIRENNAIARTAQATLAPHAGAAARDGTVPR